MMKKTFTYVFSILYLAVCSSCIENDLSYPRLSPDFVAFEVEGQESVNIDPSAATIEIVLGETADISAVKVLSYSTANDAEIIGGMPKVLDLTSPVKFVLRVYKDVEWTISAVQPIDRYIKCDNQVGEADIDPLKKIAYVYVTDNQSLQTVTINDMKLEPEGSVISSTTGFISVNGESKPLMEVCKFPMTLDCVLMRYFTVEYDGQYIEWSVKFLQKAVAVAVDSVDPWTFSAFVNGVTNGQGTPSLEYRKESDTDWTVWEDIKVTGTEVKAELTGLEENTAYAVRLTNGVETSEETVFQTGTAQQIANLSFDQWYQDGAAWMPNSGPDNYVWDSANPGTAGLGTVPTTPEESDVVKGKAARLETTTAMGLLAAGNIYVGQFAKVAGLGAELDWGYLFSARPLALRGYYKYSPKTVDMVKDPYKDLQGQTDRCQIQILLTDWDDRFHINTSKKQFVDFDNDKNIIAHGSLVSDKEDSDYVKFTIPLVYRNGRTPKYIVIVGAASRYGDYFTGGKGSVLKLDEFELVYDPTELTEEEYEQVFKNIL